jgi:hypothetical protein
LSILDCHSVFNIVYLLPVVCPVSGVTNVSSISVLSILFCRSVFLYIYLLPIVCHVSDVTNVSSMTNNQERTIQKNWKN